MPPSEPILTICIPTFERPGYLSECLRSVLAQTREDFRVVVLDNASTADYSRVPELHADSRVTYRRHPVSLGSVGNFSCALTEYVQAKYLLIFHDDDLMHPRFLEWELAALEENPDAAFAASCYAPFNDGEEPPRELWDAATGAYERLGRPADLARTLLADTYLHFGSTIYSTRHLRGYEPAFERFGILTDRPLLLDLAGRGPSLLLRDRLVLYRLHGGQDSVTGPVRPSQPLALYERYREALGPSLAASDAGLLSKVATNQLLYFYRYVMPTDRPALASYLRRARSRGLFRFRSLRLSGLEAILSLVKLGWVVRPVIRLRTWQKGSRREDGAPGRG